MKRIMLFSTAQVVNIPTPSGLTVIIVGNGIYQ